MFVHYRTQGLILRKVNRGETSQLFTIYTRDYGKLKILGKAIRKIKSKLRSGADLFYLTNVEFIQGKNYKTLTDTILIDSFQRIRKELGRLTVANKVSESLDSFAAREEKDEKIWRLLLKTFIILNDRSLLTKSLQLVYYYFFWKLSAISGYKPDLYNCFFCQKKLIPQHLFFNHQEGGIVCNNCFQKKKKGEKISSETIKILRIIITKDWKVISRLKISNENLKSLKEISELYFFSVIKPAIPDF